MKEGGEGITVVEGGEGEGIMKEGGEGQGIMKEGGEGEGILNAAHSNA